MLLGWSQVKFIICRFYLTKCLDPLLEPTLFVCAKFHKISHYCEIFEIYISQIQWFLESRSSKVDFFPPFKKKNQQNSIHGSSW